MGLIFLRNNNKRLPSNKLKSKILGKLLSIAPMYTLTRMFK